MIGLNMGQVFIVVNLARVKERKLYTVVYFRINFLKRNGNGQSIKSIFGLYSNKFQKRVNLGLVRVIKYGFMK